MASGGEGRWMGEKGTGRRRIISLTPSNTTSSTLGLSESPPPLLHQQSVNLQPRQRGQQANSSATASIPHPCVIARLSDEAMIGGFFADRLMATSNHLN